MNCISHTVMILHFLGFLILCGLLIQTSINLITKAIHKITNKTTTSTIETSSFKVYMSILKTNVLSHGEERITDKNN
jgi:hypothetical protein